jgi:hypothetical protein
LSASPAANVTANAAAPAAPTQALLLARETSAYQAWKSHDAKYWDSFLTGKFTGWGSTGRLDKASATQEFTGADCRIARVALSDAQMTPLGRNAALITHKTTFDGVCGGYKLAPGGWAASVYVRDGDQWKEAFHAEATIVDPKKPMRLAGKAAAGGQEQIISAAPDAATDALLAQENTLWDAWKDRDTKRMDSGIAANVQFINIFGIHLASRAEALKNWSGKGCDVKRVALTGARATMPAPRVGVLTFHARADGTCFGQKVGPIWASSIYVKHGDVWKWTFGINLPAQVEGG